VVADDCNKIAMEKFKFVEDKFGLQRIIPDNVPTHFNGNTLDSLWTSLKVTSCTLVDGLKEVTNHSMIKL
jgi:hypothetical protein